MTTALGICLQYHAKEEAKEAVKHPENYRVLTFAINEWKALPKDGKEFVYQGFMYDLVMTQQKGDFISVFAYKDKRETNIAKHLGSENLTRLSDKYNTIQILFYSFVSETLDTIPTSFCEVTWLHFSIHSQLEKSIWDIAPGENPPC